MCTKYWRSDSCTLSLARAATGGTGLAPGTPLQHGGRDLLPRICLLDHGLQLRHQLVHMRFSQHGLKQSHHCTNARKGEMDGKGGARGQTRNWICARQMFVRTCALGPRCLRGARFTSKRVMVDLSRPSRSAISFGDSSSSMYHFCAIRISSADIVEPGIANKAQESQGRRHCATEAQQSAMLRCHIYRWANESSALHQDNTGKGPKCVYAAYKQRVVERIMHHFSLSVLRSFEMFMPPPRPPNLNIASSKTWREEEDNRLATKKWCKNFSTRRVPPGSHMNNVNMRGGAGERLKFAVRPHITEKTGGAKTFPTPAR